MDYFEAPGAFEHLDDDTRETLVDFLGRRSLYYSYLVELTRLQIDAIMLGTTAAVDRAASYSEEVIKPIRESMEELKSELMRKSFNREHIDEMLPAITAALAQGIDLPLLFTAQGIDPDVVNDIVRRMKEFFAS